MNRRKFIQQVIYTSAITAFILDDAWAKPLIAEKTIKGKVLADNKPLAGALVSDGFNIVRTNRKGQYSIQPDEKADFVFVILPSGFEIPNENGLARFYKKINGSSDFNFDLSRLKRSDEKHNFIIWADPQVKYEEDVEQLFTQTVPDVRKLADELGAGALLHGISVGDLVWDEHNLFSAYNQAVKDTGVTFFQAIGNHDMDYGKGGDDTSDRTFKGHYGPNYYSFNRGKAHYVTLDDVRYLGTGKKYDGYISEEQLTWLKKDLSFVPKDNLIIISLHIPVHNSIKNNDALYAILASYKNVHIMSGHTHYNRNVIKNGIFEHNHGTVCGGWWRGPVCGDGTPKGYGVYQVNGIELQWYYKSTEFEKSEQLRVFVDELTGQKRIIANVWNADPQWKVEYWVDGKLSGLMENTSGFDPFTVKQSNAPLKPGQKRFPKPRKSDHIFLAHAPASSKHIQVIAVDRFGNRFEKAWKAGLLG